MRIGLRGLLGVGLAGLALVIGVTQLALPRIAARVLRDRVAKYGQVRSASVSALPALQLLWGSADSARVDAGRLSISPHQLVALLEESKAVGDLTVTASTVDLLDPGFGAGAVSLADAVLQKRGETLQISALLREAALQAALPEGVEVGVLAGQGGSVQVHASGRLFGFKAALYAEVQVSEGKLLLSPTTPLLAGLARITLFADPRMAILGVSATPVDGGSGGAQSAWRLRLRARLR